jgi:hypothetical protein
VLKPFNPALMRRYEVSPVNLAKNDDAACAEPREGSCGWCVSSLGADGLLAVRRGTVAGDLSHLLLVGHNVIEVSPRQNALFVY